MPATLDPIATIAELLTQHGPLHKDEVTRHLRDRGMDDPGSAIQWNLLEMDCPARQLVDDRWVWLPAVPAGRVFTHRVSADESTHDVLTVTPDLHPITTLCEHEQYQRLADGSAVRVVVAGYDDDLLDERDIPVEAIGDALVGREAHERRAVARLPRPGQRVTAIRLGMTAVARLAHQAALAERGCVRSSPDHWPLWRVSIC